MLKDVLKVSSLRDIFNKKPKMNDTDFDKCNLTIGSFNCRSVKSSFDEVRNLCQYCDYVFLQQHWLLPRELNILFSIHPDFFGNRLLLCLYLCQCSYWQTIWWHWHIVQKVI